MAHLNRSIRLSTKHHLWYPSPSRSVLLSFSFSVPAANAHPCKYAMTKIGNSCIRIYSKEGRKKQYVHGYRNEASNVHADDAGETIALGTSPLKANSIAAVLPCFNFPSRNLSFPFWLGYSTASSTRYCGVQEFSIWGKLCSWYRPTYISQSAQQLKLVRLTTPEAQSTNGISDNKQQWIETTVNRTTIY